MLTERRNLVRFALAGIAGLGAGARHAEAAPSARQIDHDADRALHQLFAAQPRMRDLGKRCVAMLVFPRIIKAGLLFGGQSGNGALRVQGKSAGYYNISAASFGLQAGAQAFSYVLFFMTEASLAYLRKSDGWAIGSGPSVVVIDQGMAKTINSTTLSQDVYAVPFGQRGLMAGMGLEGSKITPITVGA